MKRFAPFILAIATFPVLAQQPPQPPQPPRPPGPPPFDFVRELGIPRDQADQLEQIVLDEMQQHRAVHERAVAEMSKFLTPDQIARFENLMRGPRPQGRGAPPPPPPQGR